MDEPPPLVKIEEDEIITLDNIIDLTKPHVSRQDIQTIIKIKPVNIELYRRALIHSSIQKYVDFVIANGIEVPEYMTESFERLEYLGDAVLNLIVANLIFDKYPDSDEGFMTRLRTKIVRGTNCAKLAKVIGLSNYVLTSSKILKDSESHIVNDKVLEDSFEAIIGALYKDLGIDYAELFVKNLIAENINFEQLINVDDNYKDILMRYTQVYDYELPIYKLISSGNAELKIRKFEVKVYLKSKSSQYEQLFGFAEGKTKKEAEQSAAKDAISKINPIEMEPIINRTIKKKKN